MIGEKFVEEKLLDLFKEKGPDILVAILESNETGAQQFLHNFLQGWDIPLLNPEAEVPAKELLEIIETKAYHCFLEWVKKLQFPST